MKKLLALCVVLIAGALAGCGCGDGSVCGSGNSVIVGPSAGTPTPTPFPTPGATPDPCRIESVRVGFMSGAQLPFVSLGAVEQLDVTPMNSSGEVPKGCNVTREPVPSVITPTVCQVFGGGFNPFLRGLKVGTCIVAFNVSNVSSAPFSVEVR